MKLKRYRPDWDQYFMQIARDISVRSNCSRRQIGALIIRDTVIVSTAYNGTPYGTVNCDDGGCPRCASATGTMSSYDLCLCVHAEENAIALAARNGAKTNKCTMYCTCRPCFGCLRMCIQAGITEIIYEDEHIYPDENTEKVFQEFIMSAPIKLTHVYRTWEYPKGIYNTPEIIIHHDSKND